MEVRDWTIITEKGGYNSSFTPTKRGGGSKSFSHAQEEVILMWALEILATLK